MYGLLHFGVNIIIKIFVKIVMIKEETDINDYLNIISYM
jgi:hypothetical protein